jgi:hypothetical protein
MFVHSTTYQLPAGLPDWWKKQVPPVRLRMAYRLRTQVADYSYLETSSDTAARRISAHQELGFLVPLHEPDLSHPQRNANWSTSIGYLQFGFQR